MSADETDQEMKELAEIMAEATADKPHFERVGETDDGLGLFEVNSLDMLIYVKGLQAIKEENADE